jgi:predicted XRE-type DNA-binding protein
MTSNTMSTKTKASAHIAETVEPVEPVEFGSGNVFADLGLPDLDERHWRVQLALRLNDLLKAEGLTQAATAKLLGIAQPQVSELKNYKLSHFSIFPANACCTTSPCSTVMWKYLFAHGPTRMVIRLELGR